MERTRAKIAGTLGPASDNPRVLRKLVEAGLDVARLNFSHGGPEDHRRRVEMVRKVAARLKHPVAVMADLQGPRFRLGVLGEPQDLRVGDEVTLCAGSQRIEKGQIPVPFRALAGVVRRGHRILIDDGKVELRVSKVRQPRIFCEVVRGGEISDRKGLNLPDTELPVPALTAKDKRDLKLAVELGADWLAVSFVRRPQDVRAARRLLERHGSNMPILSKIERPEAIENLEEILDESDGLLVARGDLGVELPPERVPVLQKKMIELCNYVGKPVMTATQMLDSMRYNARPTRAEASDVANAVLDGSSCLLLTAETAVGDYPVEAVSMMANITREAEKSGRVRVKLPDYESLSVAEAASLAACRTARNVGARYVVAFTESGSTARAVSRFRPRTPILAFSPVQSVRRQLGLIWGVTPRAAAKAKSIDSMFAELDRALLRGKMVERGELVVVLCGAPVGVPGSTNLMKIHQVGVKGGAKLAAER